MDQPLIYSASWEGDQVLHDKESIGACRHDSLRVDFKLELYIPAKDKSPESDVCGA